MRWRIELSCFDFEFRFSTLFTDLARSMPFWCFLDVSVFISVWDTRPLIELHSSLCHPGVTQMYHFAKWRNLPYSVEGVRRVTNACRICAECKPKFCKPAKSHLIKATQPFERLNIDLRDRFQAPTRMCINNRRILEISLCILVPEYDCFNCYWLPLSAVFTIRNACLYPFWLWILVYE